MVLRQLLAVECPVRLIHGMQDTEVPWQTAPRIAATLTSSDVQTLLIKDAGHRLSREGDLDVLGRIIESLTA